MPGSITCNEANDEWSQGNEVVIQFTARRTNCEYQTLHLSRAEANKVGAVIVSCMSKEGRRKLVPDLLRDLSDADLLKALATDLRNRVAAK